MNRLAILLAVSAGVTVTATMWALLRPPRRLRARVRPYVHVARSRLLRSVDPETYLSVTRTPAGIREAFEPLIGRLSRLHSGILGPRDEESLALRLRQSGLYPRMEAGERIRAFRNRSLATAGTAAVILGTIGWQSQGAAGLVAYAAGGFVLGSLMSRGRIDS
ncbi:MAG TPA: hypothetical protein ENH00_11070, partial [Actinobacteria bacterium]|nr:hypothetical protein [Actinomycetota bacterium]